MSATDLFISYKFIRQLSKPWKEWEAYDLGLIDDKGKTLRKAETPEENNAMSSWKILVKNVKKFLEKLPFGKTKLGSFAAALWLIKEEMEISDIAVLEKEFTKYLDTTELLIEENTYFFGENLEPGLYKYNNMIIRITESTKPVGYVFHIPVFEINDITKSEKTIITIDQLEV